MTYAVKEIFRTLQGEGANAGRTAVFCRFSGCNLWSGREEDRAMATCSFCDTAFVGTDGRGGAKFATADDVAGAIERSWGSQVDRRLVVLTGGEPLLQVDEPLVRALKARHFEIALETNGTLAPPIGIDWVCVSPKANSDVVVRTGNELKVVYPQRGIDLDELSHWAFDHFFIQPMDGPEKVRNTESAIAFCQENPTWRLSVQVHKLLGIP